jgi:putative transposase
VARLARLVLAGQAHYVIQRGHSGQPVFVDDADRQQFLAALHEAAAAERVQLHAYALLDSEVHLLATPETASTLSRMMQALGRRYVSTYNRRHSRSGTLWDGRFRCAVVEPGLARLDVLRLIDGLSAEPGTGTGAASTATTIGANIGLNTSAGTRAGGHMDARLQNTPEYWQLGNTPFEREAAYRSLLAVGVPAERKAALRRAALGGWAAGQAAFATQLETTLQRPARPRSPGRPRRAQR